MSKKGLFASLIVCCVLTLSLGVYTLVSVFGGSNPAKPQDPTNVTVNATFRTEDVVSELSGYALEDVKFELAEGAVNPIEYNEETVEYKAVSAGEVTVVVTLDENGNTKTLVIKVYAQGDGSSENPFIIASATHLADFAEMVNTVSAERVIPENVKLVSDIDLGELNWKPIGKQGNSEYTGTFDGNGYTIKNLNISVNSTNFEEFIAISSTSGTRAFLDLGLFGKINNAKILNLNVENATINVSSEIYTMIQEQVTPEGAEYDRIVRLTIGTIAGSAYNTDIIGVEAKSNISARINAFSCTTTDKDSKQSHGLGGVVGVAQLVRVSNYNVKANIVNNIETTKGSYVGGVFGASYSSYNVGYTNTYDAAHKTVVSNVDVDFTGNLLYKNESCVGGIIGLANNTGVVNTTVSSFKIVDNTARNFVDYSLDDVTYSAGAVGSIRSLPVSGDAASNPEVVAAFVSNIENVTVNNVDVFMLGGDVAGVIGVAGRTYTEKNGLTETMTIKDSTVSGNMIANSVGGFVWQVNPGVTISYTKIFENPVVDVDLKGHMTAGFAFINNGQIFGYEGEVEVPATEEGGEPTTKTVKTQIDVNITGMGALIEQPSTENIYLARTATYAAGFAGRTSTTEGLFETFPAKIKDFEINVVANNSINYAGIAINAGTVGLLNLVVNANFTSYNYSATDKNISTTYMVSGGVCEATPGVCMVDTVVNINVNSDVADKSLNYGATFFGGLVARYVGDDETFGIALLNSTVSGDVYFNHSYENLTMGDVSYNVFAAGGLIGSIQAKTGSSEYVDALGIASIAITHDSILGNEVKNLKITVDMKAEQSGAEGYRAKGVGALVGTINTALDEVALDLSSNVITGVEIVADSETFSYSYEIEAGSKVENILLGANKLASYGASYAWNCGVENKVVDPDTMDVTYTDLAE